MSDRQWTSAQNDAITARNRSIIVSAAAGSGKTAVLVQRVISRITDPISPGSIDKMLIVTFTRAAASEMRSRINAQLSREIAKHPGNIHLQRQQMLLPTANISTIDSFCSSLVRENFNVLGISPNFRLADNAEADILKFAAVEDVIEKMYEQRPDDFAALTDSLTGNKDDSILSDIIIRLYDCVRAYPFPEEWLEQKLKMYDSNDENFASDWLKILSDHAADMLYDCAKSAKEALDCAILSGEVYAAYGETLQSDYESLMQLYELLRSSDQIDIAKHMPVFANLKRLKSNPEYEDIKTSVQTMRNSYKKQCQEACKLLSYDIDTIRTQNYYIQPIISALFEAINLFSQTYAQMKADKQLCDFGDLVHMSLRLLVKRDNTGNIIPTQTAMHMADQFDEILIDEYQDTNLAQDTIFKAISKNERNLFMVGDVKQSIYRFRQAMPQIFLEKLLKYDLYDADNSNQARAKILLDKNFRSRHEVTTAVNYIFSILMKKDFGKIEYDDSHSLKPGASYPDCGQYKTQVLLTDCYDEGTKYSTDQRDIFEARSIGHKIKQMIDSGFKVTEDGVTRNCTYGDFCILLPTAKNKAYKYFDELSRQGIPVWTQGSDYLFDKIEVKQFISYLKILDNPLQDIELMTALKSPLFGFSDDELLQIRKKQPKGNLFNAVNLAAKSDQKCADFLNTYHQHRDASTQLTVCQLINLIFEQTSYPAVIRAVCSQEAMDNLHLLLQYVGGFEQAGHKGLSRFLRYIYKIDHLDNVDLSSASGISDGNDVVRIMTIHKSKGLEFPICIIADTTKKFGKGSGSDKLLFHPDMGVGIVSKDATTLEEYRHIAWQAIKIVSNSDDLSERLRVLYVAMTRAKEHIIFSICSDDIQTLLTESSRLLDNSGNGIPFRLGNAANFAQWILACAMRFKSASQLCEQYGVSMHFDDTPETEQWEFEFVPCCTDDNIALVEQQEEACQADEQTLDMIKSRLDYRYLYQAETAIPAKITASGAAHSDIAVQYTAQRIPSFAAGHAINGAQRGTALHLFLQYADLSGDKSSIIKQRDALVSRGKLTKEQADAIDLSKIEMFIDSRLYELMQNADTLYREYSFSSQIPMSYIPQLPDIDETVVLQGTIDCLIIKDGHIIIADYKSDRVVNIQVLAERYTTQLMLYKAAAERIFKLPVSHCYIYSIDEGKLIEV